MFKLDIFVIMYAYSDICLFVLIINAGISSSLGAIEGMHMRETKTVGTKTKETVGWNLCDSWLSYTSTFDMNQFHELYCKVERQCFVIVKPQG